MAVFALLCSLISHAITWNHPQRLNLWDFLSVFGARSHPGAVQGTPSHLPKSRGGYLDSHRSFPGGGGGGAVAQCPGKGAVLRTFLIDMTEFLMPTLERKRDSLVSWFQRAHSTCWQGRHARSSCLPRSKEKETQEKAKTRHSP